MIQKIGVIFQDAISFGFILGLRDRLNCKATLVFPPTAMGTTKDLPRRQAKLAWEYFRKQGTDLVVRFTDSDQDRWQDVVRSESTRVPDEAKEVWICGVAVRAHEDWLALDAKYLADQLQIDPEVVSNPDNRIGLLKDKIRKSRGDLELGEFVANLVREAPIATFRIWLANGAFKRFYADCRNAAKRCNCDTPNEEDRNAED